MTYEEYKQKIEKKRAVLRKDLEKSNELRADAKLPLRDVENEVKTSLPLKTKEKFLAHNKDAKHFNEFRKRELEKYDVKPPNPTDDWQQQKAITARNLYVEHEIKTRWKDHKKGL